MKRIAVVTDSNSGITQTQAEKFKLYVLPMPFTIDGKAFFEDINLTQEEFYKKLREDSDISTSQPALGAVIELWDSLLEDYDEVVYIPMSSALSTSCGTASAASKEYEGKVHVVDNRRISVTQRQSALDALELADSGWSGWEIKEYLEKEKYNSSVYIMVDTLKYLKRGGRVTPAAAAIGTVLNIKPVLQIQGDKLDSYAKARGVKQARKIMIDAIRKDFKTRFKEFSEPEIMWLQVAYTFDEETALDFKNDVEREFPGFEVHMSPLSLSVSCHIGPGALAIACSKKINCVR